jgi:hypothetical protein
MKDIVATFKHENFTLIITKNADARLSKLAVQAFQKRGEGDTNELL